MLRTLTCAALAAMLLAVPLVSAEDDATEAAPDESQNPRVLMKTSKGDITIELYEAEAPISVANFLKYVDAGFYDGTIFHRIVPGFVIQGGGFTPDMTRRETNPAIKNEATNGLKNLRGTLSMARTSVVDSATSQFFVNTKDNVALDHRGTSTRTYGYAVFGRVVDGMDVVDAIEKVQTGIKGGMRDVPVEPVVIESATRL